MIYLSDTLLLLYLLVHAGHSSLLYQMLSGTVPGLSTKVDLNKTTAASSTQSYSRSQSNYSVNSSGIHPSSLTKVPNPLPPPFQGDGYVDLQNYLDIESGFCAINDNYCSFEGNNRTKDLTTKVFNDQCLLWDTSCSGNRALAMDEFFNTTEGLLFDNLCFSQFSSGVPAGDTDISIPEEPVGSSVVDIDDVIPSDCKKYNPPERLSEWQDIKSWMRSSGCVLAQKEWTKGGGQGAYNISSEVTPSCCGLCNVGAENVDLYYWPEPGVNTSCLSVVGASVNPIAYGATTGVVGDSEAGTYWACSAKVPATSTYTYAGTNSADAETITSVYPIITTASITTIGSLAVKVSLINPWFSSPCIETDTIPQASNGSNGLNSSTELHVRHAVQARGHTLLIPSSITQENGSPVSTVILGNSTLLVRCHRIDV